MIRKSGHRFSEKIKPLPAEERKSMQER